MNVKIIAILIFSILLTTFSNVTAEIILPKIIGHNMVLQRHTTVPIWGTATKGEKITVTFGGQHKEAIAGDSGVWRVNLNPMEANAVPRKMVISGTNTITLNNILVGEVWLCSGQSNMEYSMRKNSKIQPTVKGIKPLVDDLSTANNSSIRIFLVRRKFMSPDSTHSGWNDASGLALRDFSAVGYFYAKELYQKLHIPIGVISSAVPGSRIEPWIEASKMDVSPKLKNGKVLEPLSADKGDPGKFYNTMIQPLIPYALRGFIWYQGESNCFLNENIRYAFKFKTLIESWRSDWKNPEMPFNFVQIAPYGYATVKDVRPHTTENLPEFWEAQALVLNMPNTGMITITDLVDSIVDIHPAYKWEVGRRLSLVALKNTYGFKETVCSGPVYRKIKIANNKIIVSFTDTGSSLVSRDGKPLTGFMIAGADGKFVQANAEIVGQTVIVSSPDIQHPVSVRFGWQEAVKSNFINNDGLPAVPFRSNNPWTKIF